MFNRTRYLFVIKFAVRHDAGLALVVAYTEREAGIILQNSGVYGKGAKYNIINVKNLGETCTCEYGLIFESYASAWVAFDALVSVMDQIRGPKGDKGDKGDPGEVTRESIEAALGYLPGKISVNTTVGWNNAVGYIPIKGEVVIYSDYGHRTVDGHIVNVANIKVGDGNAYVQDLQFIAGGDFDIMLDHINNHVIHITDEERQKWNAKLNVDDNHEVVDEALVFIRN